MENRVRQILADIFGRPVEDINDNASTDTVEEWDSLSNVYLVLALETEFGVKLTMEEMSRLVSFKNIIALLKEKRVA